MEAFSLAFLLSVNALTLAETLDVLADAGIPLDPMEWSPDLWELAWAVLAQAEREKEKRR